MNIQNGDQFRDEIFDLNQELRDFTKSIFTMDLCKKILEKNDHSMLINEVNNWRLAILNHDVDIGSEMAILLFEWIHSENQSDWENIILDWKHLIDKLSKHGTKQENQIYLWHQIGILLTRLGRQKEALQAFEKSLDISNNLKIEFFASNFYETGIIYRDSGKFTQAFEMFRKSENSAIRTGDLKTAIYAQGQKANILTIQGSYQEAINILKQSLILWNQFPEERDRNLRHTTLHTLGRILVQTQQYEEAIQSLNESLHLKLKTSGRFDSIIRTKSYFTEALLNLGRIDDALNMLDAEEIEKCSEMGNYLYAATAFRILSRIYFIQKDTFHAFLYANRSVETAILSGNPATEIETMSWSISLHLRKWKLFYVINYIPKLIRSIFRLKLPFNQKVNLIFIRLKPVLQSNKKNNQLMKE